MSSLALCGGKGEDVAKQHYTDEALRQKQFDAALAWCKEHDQGACAAVAQLDDNGCQQWPLVKRGALDNRLKGKVDNENPYPAQQVLTTDEEDEIVWMCTELNQHAQGIDREHLGKVVHVDTKAGSCAFVTS